MSKRRVLVTGGTGQVGTELLQRVWPDDVELIAPTRSELDLTDCEGIEEYISTGDFAAVVNSGAYTAVDKAESDVLTAWKVNALAPAAIAAASKRRGIPIVHISTDYVFDGSKIEPYVEDDPVAPLGVYGASKEAGEQAVRTGNPRHVILRTAWVFSPHGANFVKTMLRLGAERTELRVVDDQRGSPTAAADIAEAIKTIVLRQLSDFGAPAGTYQFVNAGDATWCEFARQIFDDAASPGKAAPKVTGIPTSEYPTPARRPRNSCLSVEAIKRDFDVAPRPWREALKSTLKLLLSESRAEVSRS